MNKLPETKRRQRAERWGQFSEWIAALYLLCKGYRIIAMRYKTKSGEIDIIAKRGKLITMIEVKARKTVQEAIDAVSPTAQKRINNATDIWLSRQKNPHLYSIRFDIIAVRPWRWPSHFKDAF